MLNMTTLTHAFHQVTSLVVSVLLGFGGDSGIRTRALSQWLLGLLPKVQVSALPN
jgi:hypothetical protein